MTTLLTPMNEKAMYEIILLQRFIVKQYKLDNLTIFECIDNNSYSYESDYFTKEIYDDLFSKCYYFFTQELRDDKLNDLLK